MHIDLVLKIIKLSSETKMRKFIEQFKQILHTSQLKLKSLKLVFMYNVINMFLVKLGTYYITIRTLVYELGPEDTPISINHILSKITNYYQTGYKQVKLM